MNLKRNEEIQENLSLRLKLIILFIDYIIIIGIISILDFLSITGLEQDYAWLFRLSIYFLYYVFPEYVFKCTLGMRLFNVSLKTKTFKDFKKRFFLYSVLVFFDRCLLLVIYIFGVLLLTNKNLLLSEKYSGLRWQKIAPSHE